MAYLYSEEGAMMYYASISITYSSIFMQKSIVVTRSISFCLQDGDFASSIGLGVIRLDLAFKWFVILLSVRVEVFDFEEAHFEDILIQSEFALDQWHNRRRPIV